MGPSQVSARESRRALIFKTEKGDSKGSVKSLVPAKVGTWVPGLTRGRGVLAALAGGGVVLVLNRSCAVLLMAGAAP